MTDYNTKKHTNHTQSNAQMHQGFVDDPIAESYDRHGRYYQKKTFVYKAGHHLGEGDFTPGESLTLFRRGNVGKKRKPMMNRVTPLKYKKKTEVKND